MTDSANMIPTEETTLQVSEEKNVHSLTKEEIAAELRRILEEKDVNAHKEVTALKQALFALRQREINEEMNSFVEAGGNPTEFSATPDETEAEAKELIAKFREMRTEYLEAEEKRLEANLEKKKAIVAEMKSIVEDADNVNQHFPRFQELQKEFRDIKEVTPSGEAEIWKEFQQVSEQFYDTLKINKELRDLDFKKNLEAKRRLIEETIALQQEEVITEASRKLQQLHAEWREIGPVVKELQAKWRTIGYASRKVNNELYARYRKACDDFFEAKSAYISEVKANLQCNYEKKVALSEKAESLKDAENLSAALEEVQRLQDEWKKIGSVPRKLSDAVWERFSGACRAIYDRKRKVSNERHNLENANLKAKREVIAALKEIPTDIDRREGLRQVKELQNRWNETGHVPYKMKDQLYADYRAVCDTLYGAFNTGREQERRKNFNAQLDTMKGDNRKLRSERDRLMRVLEAKQQELKTYNNNLGFFNIKSAQGNSMLKDMERKMQRIENDIKDIRAKIDMIAAEEK